MVQLGNITHYNTLIIMKTTIFINECLHYANLSWYSLDQDTSEWFGRIINGTKAYIY